MANFDVKRIARPEWAGIGAGAFIFLISFTPWFTHSLGGFSVYANAWNSGFAAWFPVLLLMTAGGLVLAPHFGIEIPRLPLTWLILSGVALLLLVLCWATASDATLLGRVNAEFGLVLGLLTATVSGTGAF